MNALTLLPVSPGLMLLAVCDWHGALMCSPSWCSSWLRRAKPSCSPCWGCMDAEGSRKAKCPAAVLLGFSEVEVGDSSVSWGCPGCAKVSPRTSSLCFGCRAIMLVSPKGDSHRRSCFSWSAFWSPEPSCPVLLPVGPWVCVLIPPPALWGSHLAPQSAPSAQYLQPVHGPSHPPDLTFIFC